MYSDVAYQGSSTRDRTATLFGQTMGLVAMTAGFFALGAYAGRNLSEGAVIVAWIAAFVALLIMNFVARRSSAAAVVLLVIFGVLMGVASAPTSRYSGTGRSSTCSSRPRRRIRSRPSGCPSPSRRR